MKKRLVAILLSGLMVLGQGSVLAEELTDGDLIVETDGEELIDEAENSAELLVSEANDTEIVPVEANPGDLMSTAVDIIFGQSYTKSWTMNTSNLNHYCKVIIPQQGILTINATKPFDSKSQYGSMYFTLFDEEGEGLWGNETYYAKDSAKDFYSMNVGLTAGVYYLTIKPAFWVTSGVISTSFSLDFTPSSFCEIEPNETIGKATPIILGQVYTGYFGTDGASDYEDNDYWSINLEAGKVYKIAIGNYEKISSTTAILQFLNPNGDAESLYKIQNRSDENDFNYILFEATMTGKYIFRLYNYIQTQFVYQILCEEVEKQDQLITGIPSEITKYVGDPEFSLGATAATTLSYASSNTDVASLLSDGTVYIRNAGTTDITITAKETIDYKPATFVVKLIVKKKDQEITGVDSEIKLLESQKNYYLNAKAETRLSYISSNTEVASVSSTGKITINKAGRTTITITAEESAKYNSVVKEIVLIVGSDNQPTVTPTPTPTPIPTATPTPSPMPTPASDWTGNEQITDLKAKSTPDGSDLTWSKIPEADGYLIGAIQNGKPYRQIDFIVGGNTTEYLDINASLTDYSYYWVFPYKKVNGKVVRGAASSIYVYGIKQLLAPKNLKATGKTGGVDLGWDSVSDADGFIIKRRTGSSGSAVVIADVTGTSYTDTTASTTDNSFYWVYAYKKSGNTKRPGAISSYAYAKAK